jgi:type VI secretion system secreted protein Hcp
LSPLAPGRIWQDAAGSQPGRSDTDKPGGWMAQVDYFLKFDGIKGESADAKHKDEIDVEAWSWGETNAGAPARGGGGGAGKVSMQDFHFVMRMNTASVSLMKACATGQHIKEATLTARKAGKGQQEFLVVKMNDVLISSYQTGGSEGGDPVPTDQVSFNFAKIDVEYKRQKPDGSLDAGVHFKYDLKAQKEG